MPKISSYGRYASQNYGLHCMTVEIGSLTVYFSYDTPVAFSIGGHFVVRQNDFSKTTGKHLNWIESNKRCRVSSEEFERQWNNLVEPFLSGIVPDVIPDLDPDAARQHGPQRRSVVV